MVEFAVNDFGQVKSVKSARARQIFGRPIVAIFDSRDENTNTIAKVEQIVAKRKRMEDVKTGVQVEKIKKVVLPKLEEYVNTLPFEVPMVIQFKGATINQLSDITPVREFVYTVERIVEVIGTTPPEDVLTVAKFDIQDIADDIQDILEDDIQFAKTSTGILQVEETTITMGQTSEPNKIIFDGKYTYDLNTEDSTTFSL